MKNSKLKQIIKVMGTSILLLNLSACATYKSSFNCGDAKGAYCSSMDAVDQMINSGEIERFNEIRQKEKKYKPLKNSNIQLPATKDESVDVSNKEVSDARN